MELACPNCETQFFVADNAIGAKGRNVRCSSCTHVWHASSQSAATPPMDLTQKAPTVPASDEFHFPVKEGADSSAAPVIDEPFASPLASAYSTSPPPARRRKGKKRLMFGVLLLIIVGATYGLRSQIVEMAPQTAKYYRMAGIPVPGVEAGLKIVDARFGGTIVNGQAVIRVTGSVVNEGGSPQSVPQLEVILTGTDGARFARKTVNPPQPVLEPGQPARLQVDFPGDAASIAKAEVKLVGAKE
jgi:predicted Zn finger-like uncharacterized protein